VNSWEKWWFWVVLVVNPAVWTLLGVVALLRTNLGAVVLCDSTEGFGTSARPLTTVLQPQSTSSSQ
jgi:hypothetical protein